MALNIKGFFPLDHPPVTSEVKPSPPGLFTGEDQFDDAKESRENRPKDHNLVYAKAKLKLDIISSG